MSRRNTALLLGICVPLLAGAEQPDKAIVPHPRQLTFPPLNFRVPPAEQFRHVLSNGIVVFVGEDRLLPTFDLAITVRTGAAFDPPEKAGLAALVGEQMRDGGTESLAPEELDERIEFLAASISTRIGDTEGRVNLSCLSKDIDAGLALLVDVLRHPRFDEERFRKATERTLQNIKRRNDSTDTIEEIEWGFLMDGAEHFSNRYPGSATIGAITRDDLRDFHKRFIHPGNMIVSVVGDFATADILARLEKVFADWPAGEKAPREFPAPQHKAEAGAYVVHKEGVNQGRVSVGHKSVMRGSPDEFALMVMDAILGGGGFRARLVARVRSDEGLAYSVGSNLGQGVYYASDFQCFLQTRSDAVPYACRLVLEEINRLRTEKVSADDLQAAIDYYVENFPQRFQTRRALLNAYLFDEHTGRDPQYWQTFVDNVKKVTVDDVLRVAQTYLHPDQLVILAVGDADAIIGGGYDKAKDLKLEALGKVTRLSVRDPDTLKR